MKKLLAFAFVGGMIAFASCTSKPSEDATDTTMDTTTMSMEVDTMMEMDTMAMDTMATDTL